jgi:predicted ATPase/DNA-binding winged helix-turn-helix (wHTH) protein
MDVQRFPGFEVRTAQRQLLVDGRPVPLGARAFDVLLALSRSPGHPVSKSDLLEAAWPGLVVEENNLAVQVSTLRKALGPQTIATIPGRGYCLAAEPTDSTDGPPPSRYTETAQDARQPRPLIGREREARALARLLDDHRLVTIAGSGGIGKTRLAASAVGGSARRRRVWVELAACIEATQLASTVARAAGVQLGAGETDLALAAALRDHQVLIVLDNAEHLIAGVVGLVGALLEHAPGVRLLVTSQVPLHLDGEAILALGALDLPELAGTIESVVDCPSVALFVERAQASRPGFAVDAQNVVAVVELCRHLDGVPLALELAAARVGTLGVPALADMLGARLHVLRRSAPHVPPRHETLRRTLDWSHGMLDERNQRVFRRLAVFVATFTLDAVRRVVPDDTLDEWSAVDALAHLVERSLVVVVENGARMRYRLLETQRLYARERLAEASETDRLLEGHARAMRAIFEEADARFFDGTVAVDAWREAMAHEVDDGLAAWRWAVDHDPESALGLAACIDWALMNAPSPQRHLLWEATMPLIDRPGIDEDVRARWLRGLVISGQTYGTDRRWIERLREASVAQALRGRDALAYLGFHHVLWGLSCQGDLADRDRVGAEALIERMRDFDATARPAVLRYFRMRSESTVCRLRGDFASCVGWLRLAVENAIEAGDSRGMHSARAELLDAELAAGWLDDVLRDAGPTIAALRGSPFESTMSHALVTFAATLVESGRLGEAEALAIDEWPRIERFALVDEWTDVLASLLALDSRLEAAARLVASRRAQRRAAPFRRQVNEQRAFDRAERLVAATVARDEGGRSNVPDVVLSARQIRDVLGPDAPIGGA